MLIIMCLLQIKMHGTKSQFTSMPEDHQVETPYLEHPVSRAASLRSKPSALGKQMGLRWLHSQNLTSPIVAIKFHWGFLRAIKSREMAPPEDALSDQRASQGSLQY